MGNPSRTGPLFWILASVIFMLAASILVELYSLAFYDAGISSKVSLLSIGMASVALFYVVFSGILSGRNSEKGTTSRLIRTVMISLGFAIFFFLIILPLTSIFKFAAEDGWSGFWSAVTSEEALNAFCNSLLIAVLCTLINLVSGTLIAYILTKYRFPGRTILRGLIDLPIAIPTAVVGLSLMMLYGPMGLLGPFLQERGIQVVLDMPGVVLAHVFVTFPFMVRSTMVVMEKLDPNLVDSSRILGAGGLRTFFSVILPSIRSGMIAGGALTFTRSLGEFGATLFVAGGVLSTGPLYIAVLNEDIKFQEACSISIVLMVFPFLVLIALNYLVDRMEGR
ncbi:MAG: ABC transporter permease [Thermoplasmatota archaeon]